MKHAKLNVSVVERVDLLGKIIQPFSRINLIYFSQYSFQYLADVKKFSLHSY